MFLAARSLTALQAIGIIGLPHLPKSLAVSQVRVVCRFQVMLLHETQTDAGAHLG